jgi:hypothetical protein
LQAFAILPCCCRRQTRSLNRQTNSAQAAVSVWRLARQRHRVLSPALLGKYDRPWFERPIFGLIRSMSGASTGKKFDSKKYMQQNLFS